MQKRLYNKEQRRERMACAKGVMRLSIAALREKLSLSLDGVILTMRPDNPTDR